MIITLKDKIKNQEVEKLISYLENEKINAHFVKMDDKNLLVFNEELDDNKVLLIKANPLVKDIKYISTPYKLVSREFKQENSIINVGNVKFGDSNVIIMAGPCSIEGKKQIEEIASLVKESGANVLRGGAYKPRKSPYFFQGLGYDGIKMLVEAKNKYDIPVVSEVTSIEELQEFGDVDIIQVGARNMQNYELLKALGKVKKPILLKRGMSSTIEELLMSAEYIMLNGNKDIILCERGIRTFETATRNTLDLSSVPLLKKLTHLPVVVDPSHATGNWELVEPMSLAAIAAGADGLLIEVHNNPNDALSDGYQSLKIDKFNDLMDKAKKIAKVMGRDIK